MDLRAMTTESRNSASMDLDIFTPLQIAQVMNDEDKKVPEAVSKILPEIAKAIEVTYNAFENGGRLFYIGAGTSGRLGVLDASECPPTFGVPFDMVVGLIAGGDSAIRKAVEGAEDSLTLAVDDLKSYNLSSKDVVIGAAASGRTPYVIGGLEYAKSIGCFTSCIVCNKGSKISQIVDLPLEAEVGPEVLTGSTRLKAGTATKLIMNMITTGAMVRTGKAYHNLMVNVVQSNEKLHVRAENIVTDATGVTREVAREYIDKADGSVKLAITMILTGLDQDACTKLLENAHGHIREAVSNK